MERKKPEIFVGSTIRTIRKDKGVLSKDLARVIGISPSHLANIEKDKRSFTATQFIVILCYLEISFDEFCLLASPSGDYLKDRTEMKALLTVFSRKRGKRFAKRIINKAQKHQKKYDDPYFAHVASMMQAIYTLEESDYDFEKARFVLQPVTDYLSSIKNWYEYEIALFSNSFYIYPIEDTLKIGRKILADIKENHASARHHELTHALLLNLSMYALNEKKYCLDAIELSNQSLLSPTANLLYTPITVKIIQQIAHYKLESGDYSEAYVVNLVKGMRLLDFFDLAEQTLVLLKKHGIEIDDTLFKY